MLRQVRGIQRPSGDSDSRPQPFVQPPFSHPLLEGVDDAVGVVKRKVEEPGRPVHVRRRVHLARKGEEGGVISDEANLIVGLPRGQVEVAGRVGVKPSAREAAVGHILCRREARKRPEKRRAWYLIAVKPKNPPARALLVQPGQGALRRRRVRHTNEVIGECCAHLHGLGVRALIHSNHELVRDRP